MAFVGVPPSSVMLEITSMGTVGFEPLITRIEITRGCAADRFIVTVCPLPTFGAFAYQTWLRRSTVGWFVGPAAVIQVFALLSDSVSVTPPWDDPKITIKSPPVLSNAAVVWVVRNVLLM